MTYVAVPLSYATDALEPAVDTATMEVHYGKHYQGYTNKLNAALEGVDVSYENVEDLLRVISTLPASVQTAVRNNGGGYYNHTIFWDVMTPGGSVMSDALHDVIVDSFGSVDVMKEQFAQAAATRFGSGWAWLVVQEDGKLAVTSTPNQDNPLMDVVEESGYPILGLDVWEHAYYLHYQNRRADYISAWRDVVDWATVEERLAQAS